VNYPDQFSADVIPRESIKGDVTFMDEGVTPAAAAALLGRLAFLCELRCRSKRKVASLLLRTQVLATNFHFCT
jgi:hypothetical protein